MVIYIESKNGKTILRSKMLRIAYVYITDSKSLAWSILLWSIFQWDVIINAFPIFNDSLHNFVQIRWLVDDARNGSRHASPILYFSKILINWFNLLCFDEQMSLEIATSRSVKRFDSMFQVNTRFIQVCLPSMEPRIWATKYRLTLYGNDWIDMRMPWIT